MPRPSKVPLMIVEDDANTRFLLGVAAERSGVFQPIASAIDGRAALDVLRATSGANLPALIATDLNMPRMTGLELLRALKLDPVLRSIPVVVISSSDAAADRERTLAEGAAAFVPKPYGIDALINIFLALRETCGETAGARAT